MAHELSFDLLLDYDSGLPGISLEVELRFSDYVATVPAKVDTGADRCIFARSYGEDLDLDIETGQPQRFGTPVGSFLAYGHRVTVVTAGFSFDSTVYFAADDNFNHNVLGRFGWLDRMVIAINDYDGKLYLKPYESE